MLTITNIQRFAKIRNVGSPPSNLQFMYDLKQAGIEAAELPDPVRIEGGYEWDLKFCKMREVHGKISYETTS